MCIIALAHDACERYSLVVAANRDENHLRPTLKADWWPDRPNVLGGRDLEAGGMWLAVDRGGRLAAVTNLHVAGRPPAPGARSRGLLVGGFVGGQAGSAEFAAALAPVADEYGPFNLLLFDGRELCYASNYAPRRTLGRGVHAFSNAAPEAKWPKIERARRGLASLLDDPEPTEALFALLAQTDLSADGFDARQTSLFQLDAAWGTRCSTVVLIDRSGRISFSERRFDPEGRWSGEDSYEFRLSAAA